MITDLEFRKDENGKLILWAYDDINHYGWFRVPVSDKLYVDEDK